jgi:hypothetical protein
MAYLGNDDLGRSLQVGGSSMNPVYSQIEDDFAQRVGSGVNKYQPYPLFIGSGGKKDIEKLGEVVAQMIAKQNPDLVASGVMTGGSFWDSLKKGFHKVVKAVAPVVKKLAPIVKSVAPLVAPGYGTALVTGMNAVGLGKKKPRKKRVTSDKMKRRGKLVGQLMREQGLTLPEASRYIKENNLI